MRYINNAEVTRRTLFSAGLSAAAISAAAAATMDPVKVQRPVFKAIPADSLYALMAKDNTQITSALNQSQFRAKARELVKFGFLGPFQQDLSVDQIVFDETLPLNNQKPPYDPYQLDALISSASSLLDRCLANRREMYDIEEQAIRWAMEYDLFNKQLDPQKNLDLAEYVEKQRTLELQGQLAATDAFKKSSDQNAPAYAAISDATAQSTQQAVKGDQDRKSNVLKKWDAAVAYQQALQDRHTTPGCSLNFTERFGRIEQLLRQDIRVAFQKLRCIEWGLNRVFALSVKLSDPVTNGYLDVMVQFLRDAVVQAELATVEEIEFTHVVSARQPRITGAGGGGASPLVSDADWLKFMGSEGTSVAFSLTNEFSPAISKMRITGIGVSALFKADAGLDINSHNRSLAAVVFPPDVKGFFDPASVLSRPPVVFGNVTWYDPADLRLQQSPGVSNIDPREGTWTVLVSPNILGANAQGAGRSTLSDVKLHLRLAALVDKSLLKWTGFSA